MKSLLRRLVPLTCAVATTLVEPSRAKAAPPAGGPGVSAVERVALVVGANNGGPRRATLRYAGSDAREVAGVLRSIGGVRRKNEVLVYEPTPARLRRAFDEVARRTRAAAGRGNRVELIFYYSGHSDESGLLLDGQSVGYKALRQRLQSVPADVRVAILDSCASGAFTRQKGGTKRPPFLVGSAQDVKGHAYLTSSSADENAQESDRIGGSFFTHYLTTGLRGAADANGDRVVTLGEAYQFAFDETLARTETTQAGPQHAAYDISLAGSGDLVMTDLRSTSGRMVLGEDIGGRVFVRDRSGHLRAELYKPAGSAPLVLALEPGRYKVTVDVDGKLSRATLTVPVSGQATLSRRDLSKIRREETTERGHQPEDSYVRVPFNLGIMPVLSVGGNKHPTITHFSAALLWSRTSRLHGLALALALDIADEEVRGVQSTLLGSISRGIVVGAQLSTLFNYTHDNIRGAQLTTGVNIARSAQGAQISSGINYAGALRGLQGGLVNATAGSGTLTGMQLGLLNVGGDVRGVQLGLVNYARSADAAFGLISVTKEGNVHPEVWTSDTAAINVGLRLPARYTYSFLAAGMHPGGKGAGWQFGFGLGGHIKMTERAHLDIDVAGYAAFGGLKIDSPMMTLGKARVLFAWQFMNRLSVFGGPTFNILLDDIRDNTHRPGYGYNVATRHSGNQRIRMWPGFAGGVRF